MIDPSIILANINQGLREPLLLHFQSIRTNYIERRWEPSELNGGKFAEVVYTIISDILNGTQSQTPSKPKNMLAACQALEQVSSNSTRVGDRSLRILIPRTLPILYEIRNNRNVGHVGGEIDPNFMDATTVYSLANWVLAELIRIAHNIKIEDAQLVVDGIVERKQLLVWEINDMKRVLNPELPKKDQALLLL